MLYAAALIAIYFVALVVLSVMARPHRVRMATLANELLADYPSSSAIRQLCSHCLATAYSMRIAPIRLCAYVAFLFKPGREIDEVCDRANQENPELFRDPRVGRMLEAYNASTTAASPVFGLLASVARYAFILKAIIHHREVQSRDKYAELVDLRAAT